MLTCSAFSFFVMAFSPCPVAQQTAQTGHRPNDVLMVGAATGAPFLQLTVKRLGLSILALSIEQFAHLIKAFFQLRVVIGVADASLVEVAARE